MKKKIYDFHYNLVDKHIKELKTTGKTIIKSHFLLQIFKERIDKYYTIIKELDLKGKVCEFQWSGTHSHNRCWYANKRRVIKLIRNGRIRRQDFETVMTDHFYDVITSKELDVLFDKKSSFEQVTPILHTIMTEPYKISLINRIGIFKFMWVVIDDEKDYLPGGCKFEESKEIIEKLIHE